MAKQPTNAPVKLVARARAAWHRAKGGIILRGEYTKPDQNGQHFRVLLDGGNKVDGRMLWVLVRCNGGGYSLPDAAMGAAVAAVLNVDCGKGPGQINNDWYDEANWKQVAKEHGWTLNSWQEDWVITMCPDEKAAEAALADYTAWMELYGHD